MSSGEHTSYLSPARCSRLRKTPTSLGVRGSGSRAVCPWGPRRERCWEGAGVTQAVRGAGPEQGGGLGDRAPWGDKNTPIWRAAGPELGVPQGAQWPPPQAAGQPVCASHCTGLHRVHPVTARPLRTRARGRPAMVPPPHLGTVCQPRSNGAGEASAALPSMDRCYQAPPPGVPWAPSVWTWASPLELRPNGSAVATEGSVSRTFPRLSREAWERRHGTN